MATPSKLPAPISGLSIEYLPVNMAYALLWNGKILRIISDRAEALTEFKRLTDVTP